MSAEKKTEAVLTMEIESLRQQVAHLRDGNQRAIIAIEKRTAELRALNAIGQATAVETNLSNLYNLIHAEIAKVLGEVNFMIALYDADQDQIEIVYAYEEGEHLRIDPFPLGEGLTSIVIRTRQPLMLVEDTLTRSHHLGAKVVGAPAKSWLGVPLIVAGDIIGAIIVQDLERDHRFDEDDQRLLSTLASQVAIAINNMGLIEAARAHARRQQLLLEITNRIRGSIDLDTILHNTVRELGLALSSSNAFVQIGLEDVDGAGETQE
jgi:GAF domain-containing protein